MEGLALTKDPVFRMSSDEKKAGGVPTSQERTPPIGVMGSSGGDLSE